MTTWRITRLDLSQVEVTADAMNHNNGYLTFSTFENYNLPKIGYRILEKNVYGVFEVGEKHHVEVHEFSEYTDKFS